MEPILWIDARSGFSADRFAAALIGLGAAGTILLLDGPTPGALLAGAVAGGMGGSLLDSLLGATVQAIYWCDRCGKETEQQLLRCGTVTRQMRGLPWLGNDMVNFIASLAGAALAALSAAALGGW